MFIIRVPAPFSLFSIIEPTLCPSVNPVFGHDLTSAISKLEIIKANWRLPWD